MDISLQNLANLQAKESTQFNGSSPDELRRVMGNLDRSFIDEYALYTHYFKQIPNMTYEPRINCKKAAAWFMEHFKTEIKDCFYNRIYRRRLGKGAQLDDIFFILDDDLLVDFDTNNSEVRFLYRHTPITKVEQLTKEIRKFKVRNPKQQPQISLVLASDRGFETSQFNLPRISVNIEENYNHDFKEVHQTIIKRLNKKMDKGLVILHGKPGTGKTSYIRYLITQLKKQVIFLPPNLASAITNPELMKMLVYNPDSIFVIEDAENLVIDRNQSGGSPVSALLNITDGLLSDVLNIQVICSFNTDIRNIDSALLRKGRLVAKYEFKELEVAKAQKLSNKLGFKTNISKPMPLSDIFNQEETNFAEIGPKQKIGFAV